MKPTLDRKFQRFIIQTIIKSFIIFSKTPEMFVIKYHTHHALYTTLDTVLIEFSLVLTWQFYSIYLLYKE